jgi:REP-associated tyrosine transposase
MARLPRLHVPGAMYHVTARGNHRQDIFFKHGDRRLLDEIMSDALAKTGARVHAYCWMTNHVHLLVQVADRPLGELMQRVGTRFARAIQRDLHTTGHLFENRYHALLVDVDSYFLELLRYIHLNPVRARIVSAAHQYRWSSHRVYLNKTQQAWVHTDFALGLFSTDTDRARLLYQAFVGTRVDSDSPLSRVHPRERRVLGDDTFLQKLSIPTRYRFPATSLESIASQVCAEVEIDLHRLRAPTHHPKHSRARALIASRATDARVATLSEVARFLNRDVSSLSRAVNRYCPRDSAL